MILHLVRHGRPIVDPESAPASWPLDPAYAEAVAALRPRLPSTAAWYSSPEPKALGTARLLTDGPVTVVENLREHVRPPGPWLEQAAWQEVVARAFAEPAVPAYAGWEPLADCAQRVASAVRSIEAAVDEDVVLVGHGTAWTALVAAATQRPPDLERWKRLALPDLFSAFRVAAGDIMGP